MFSTPPALFKSYQDKTHLNSAIPAFVFSPSLDTCATDQRSKRNTPLTVCKMRALECMGRKYSLTNAENCKVPQEAEIPCGSCRSWEKCNGKRFFRNVSKIVHMTKRKSLPPLYPTHQHLGSWTVLVWHLQSLSEAPGTAKLAQTISQVFGVQISQESSTMEERTLQDIVTKCAIYRKSLFLVPVK